MELFVEQMIASREELSQLQGFWVPIRIAECGTDERYTVSEAIRQNLPCPTIIEDRCYVTSSDGKYFYCAFHIRVNPLSTPKQIKFVDWGMGSLSVSYGTYQLEGDLWSYNNYLSFFSPDPSTPIEFEPYTNFERSYRRIGSPPQKVLDLISNILHNQSPEHSLPADQCW